MPDLLYQPKILKRNDSNFPTVLKKRSFDELNYWGEWEEEKLAKTVAIVGSRRMSSYGKEVIQRIVPELVARKYTIISGFMYGVDQEAHKVCTRAGGVTLAVLGYGLGYYQIRDFKPLVDEILQNNGLIVSPFANDFKSTLWSFPQRNIIVAALATLGIIVIEADLDSGSLVTANLGRKMKKQVWAIPGPITSQISRGTNELIKNGGAKILTTAADLWGEEPDRQLPLNLSQKVDPIVRELAVEPLTADELAIKLNKPVSEILSQMSLLTIEGVVAEAGNKFKLNLFPGQ